MCPARPSYVDSNSRAHDILRGQVRYEITARASVDTAEQQLAEVAGDRDAVAAASVSGTKTIRRGAGASDAVNLLRGFMQ